MEGISMLKVSTTLACMIAVLLPLSAYAIYGTNASSGGAPGDRHFHPKGKPPSQHTIEAIKKDAAGLPFSDTKDFEEYKKGFIAAPDFLQINSDAGGVAWDMERYKFFLEGKEFDSIHPSLQRQGTLNMNYGLYEVMPGVYQVRGFDLANISFVKGDSGWIIFDPLTSEETARAALKFVDEQLGKFPVKAVVYSHSHGDHWGGVRGVIDEADVLSGKVQVIAPRAFMDNAVSENVYAGNAMNRRLFYQYGLLLPANPYGHAGQGLSQNISIGNMTLIAPSHVVEQDFEEITVDGVRMIFQNTPNTEAPSNMNTFFPDKKLLWMAENINGCMHNIYTLRGAQVRDALRWSKYINRVIYMWGPDVEVMFASHHWPRWGNDRVLEVLRGQRDTYANMNNQVLFYANQGVTINQIHNVYETPKGIAQNWFNRGYHGSPEHNSRGVIQRFLGFWDANPATLIPLSPQDSAPIYVEMMGGAEKIMKRSQELYDEGKYFLAQEVMNKLVQARPEDQEAKDLLADIFEQIGYQQETPGLRNSYLSGAFELRSGIPQGDAIDSAGPDVVRAMSTELFLDFIGIRMDSKKAEGMEFTVNLITPDNGEKFVIELSNATLNNVEGFLAENPDLTLTINRTDLEDVMTGSKSLADQIADGTAKADGNVDILKQLASTLVVFNPLFEVMPGTAGEPTPEDLNDFEFGPLDLAGE
jgi:alkyl sulfatase BDS1-like metallo-beta-lactamase superfamily hydrolase